MKLFKYFAGSLIISFGVLIVVALLLRAMQVELIQGITPYIFVAWVVLALVILPFAKRIIRV